MKRRWLKIAMVIILAGCSSNTNTNENIALNNLAKQFEEDTRDALYDLVANTVEANEYQICSNVERFGTHISPAAVYSFTGFVLDINITPQDWDDSMDTDYDWLEESIAYNYSEETDLGIFHTRMDDGSYMKAYAINAERDDNDPNQIEVSTIQYADDMYLDDPEPIIDREAMEDNAKNSVIGNAFWCIENSIYDGYRIDPIQMKATVQKNEEGENTIVLEPDDMDAFNEIYMQGDEYRTPLDVTGLDTNLKIDSLMYDSYQITLVLDKNNCISQVIQEYHQTAKYWDQISSCEGEMVITISKMNQDDVDKDMIKSIFTKVEDGEITEGSIFQDNV